MMFAALGFPAAESLAKNLNPPPLKLVWSPSLVGDGTIEFLPWNPARPVGEPPIPPHLRATLSDDAKSVVEGNNRFALDIFQQIGSATPDKNLLVSPFSISTALAMTYAGARGNTARQMAHTLSFALPDDRLHPAFGELMRDLSEERDGYDFNIANRLFGQADYPIKQPFLSITDRDYGAPLEPLDYKSDPEAARVRINDWVEDQTNQKIRELLPEGILNETTRLVLTNAIHFDGSWKHKFDVELTREDSFFSGNGGDSQVPMMRQLQTFPYAELPGVQLLEMPYAGDDLSLVAILPTEQNGLASLEATLTPEMLDAGLTALRETQVNVTFPKFTFDSSFKLSDTLKAMGMTDAFDPDFADLTGIANPMDERLLISDVVHKAFIDVNEEGTEAAAATAVIIGALSTCVCPPPQPKEFRADHPFLFALRDRHSGSLIFLGRVVDPGGTAASLIAVPEPSATWLIVVALTSFMLRRR
jgi:serpin B